MLPRAHRLRARRDFELVHRRGKRYSNSRLFVIVLSGQPGSTTVGVTTSRKVGKAVVRNRWRRWIRESVREVLSKLASGYKIVVVVRSQPPEAPLPSYAEVRAEVHALLERSGALPHGHSQPGRNEETLHGHPGRGAV